MTAIVEIRKTLRQLRATLARYRVRKAHRLADVLAHAFARDVLEATQATLRLQRSASPRVAYITARTAYEAAQDLALLCSDPAQYDERAALAYAIELVEVEDFQGRFRRADQAAGLGERLKVGPTPEEIVEAEAAGSEAAGPGHGKLLRDALAEARRPGRAKRHWSGMSRKRIGELIAREHTEVSAVNEIGDNFYGFLSMHGHPRLRHWHSTRRLAGNNALVVKGKPADRTLPGELAWASAYLAVEALRWSGRRIVPAG